jgi:drug/metabolite transporter (DMT)-like permease
MRLVWSQPSASADRPRALVLLGVVCIFFGGAVVGRPGGADTPRPFRAAAASMVGTGFLALLAGGAALAFQKRKTGSALTLAEPSRPSPDPDPAAGLREEEQR